MIANLVCSAATASIIQKTEGKNPENTTLLVKKKLVVRVHGELERDEERSVSDAFKEDDSGSNYDAGNSQ